MIDKATLSRLTLGVTAAVGAAVASNQIPTKYAVWALMLLAFLQAIQPRVQHGSDDVKAADEAVSIRKS